MGRLSVRKVSRKKYSLIRIYSPSTHHQKKHMRKHFETVACTVLLNAEQFTTMLSAVDERLKKHRESEEGSLMRIGSELHDVLAVLRSRHHLYEFIKNLDLPPTALNVEEELSSLYMKFTDTHQQGSCGLPVALATSMAH